MPNRIYQFNRIAVAAGLGLLFVSCPTGVQRAKPGVKGTVVHASRPLMGTTFEISVWASIADQPLAAETIQEALDHIAKLEKKISSWNSCSETSAINRAAGSDRVPIGSDLHELVTDSLVWARRTGGAFDFTGGPLFERWTRARQECVLPTKAEIQECLEHIGYEQVIVEGQAVKLAKPGMRIGFGAIGKGFAADHATTLLCKRGFTNFIIDAGGDVVVRGARGDTTWQVAIRHPRRAEFLAVYGTTDRAIATSGDYEQFFTIDDKRYAHIVDPRTGWPVRGIASATVITKRGVDADALATALNVMGYEQGLSLIEQLQDTEALVVMDDGTTHLSKGLTLSDGYLEVVR